MEYSKRTCRACGIKLPANEMKMVSQNKIAIKGKSKSGVSLMTFLGVFVGHKASQRAIGRWFFNSSQRNYSGAGSHNVLMCNNCASSILKSTHFSSFFSYFNPFVYMKLYFLLLIWLVSFPFRTLLWLFRVFKGQNLNKQKPKQEQLWAISGPKSLT